MGVVFSAGMAVLALAAGGDPEEGVVVYRCARALPITGEPIRDAAIAVMDGKIVWIGRAQDAPQEARVVDMGGTWAVPGFIDLHCHIGGGEGWDINDMVYLTNPGLGTLPTVDPEAEQLVRARAGGVTTVLYIPGSGTNLSGFGTLMKTGGGGRIADLVVRYPGALKIAQAWNPERGAGDIGASRMGMWWNLRRELDRLKAYCEGRERGEVAEDPSLEPFRALFRREIPVIVHTADARDVMETVRMMHERYGLRLIITHGEFGAYRIAGEIARRGDGRIPVNVGPRLYDFAYFVAEGRFVGLPAAYRQAGNLEVSLNTDSPVVPQEELFLQGTMAARFGLSEQDALRGLTILPARAVGIEDRAGSLETGKDADIVFWTGHPLDVRSWVRVVLIRGVVVYDADRMRRRM